MITKILNVRKQTVNSVDIKNGKFYDVSILEPFCRYIGKYVKVDGIGDIMKEKSFQEMIYLKYLKSE